MMPSPDSPVSPAGPIVVIAPDSFKGSLSAPDVARAIAQGVRRAVPGAEVRECPMADGGEGTLQALLTGDAIRLSVDVADAAGNRMAAPVALLGADAVVESAEIVGITHAPGMALAVARRSTHGIGDALRAILDHDAAQPPLPAATERDAEAVHQGSKAGRRIYVALGGSSTNDAGAGMLVALGARLLDAAGNVLPPIPEVFDRLASVDLSGLDPRFDPRRAPRLAPRPNAGPHSAAASGSGVDAAPSGLVLIAMSDVDNPLCGDHGATAVFGPQKGVTPDQVAPLDQALGRFADCLEQAFGYTARALPGAGAAGGLGFALLMLGATFRPGAEVVADQVGLPAALDGADWLITGEGRSDSQTLRGKAPFVAASLAARRGVAATLLSGAVDRTSLEALGAAFDGAFSIAHGPITLQEAIRDAAALLTDAAEQLTRLRYARSGRQVRDGATPVLRDR